MRLTGPCLECAYRCMRGLPIPQVVNPQCQGTLGPISRLETSLSIPRPSPMASRRNSKAIDLRLQVINTRADAFMFMQGKTTYSLHRCCHIQQFLTSRGV